MLKPTAYILIIVLLSLFQISFLDQIYIFNTSVNLILVLIVLLATFGKLNRALLFTIIASFILDLYSAYPFGHITFAFMIVTVLVYIVFKKIISHKTIISLLIIIISSTLLYNVLLVLSTNIFKFANWQTTAITLNGGLLLTVTRQLILNSVVMLVAYGILAIVRKQLATKFILDHNISTHG